MAKQIVIKTRKVIPAEVRMYLIERGYEIQVQQVTHPGIPDDLQTPARTERFNLSLTDISRDELSRLLKEKVTLFRLEDTIGAEAYLRIIEEDGNPYCLLAVFYLSGGGVYTLSKVPLEELLKKLEDDKYQRVMDALVSFEDKSQGLYPESDIFVLMGWNGQPP